MKRKIILPYNPMLKERAREPRKNSTLSEVLLWRHLKGKQMLGHDFDRQKPIGNFIVDFFCLVGGGVGKSSGSSTVLKRSL